VITGGAAGVDTSAEDAARARRLTRIVCEPLIVGESGTEAYRAALLDRNKLIATKCTRMVAFHDGTSRGTLHAIGCAERLGKQVLVIRKTHPETHASTLASAVATLRPLTDPEPPAPPTLEQLRAAKGKVK
jgi:predicted Rossmann fold nucleotide-binding protein DprA/Smf involved in DNA uptake